MKALTKPLLFTLLLLASLQSQALEMEYYTYGGFSEVVGSFHRMALIFSDNIYKTLFSVMLVLGIFFAAAMNYTKPMMGGQATPLAWVAPSVIGTVLFTGVIIPTGTIHVYDPTKNSYQAVPGVPDAIIAISGLFNKIEQGMVEVTDTASDYPYSASAGGINFKLIFTALDTNSEIGDYDLRSNISSYYFSCGENAQVNGTTSKQKVWENTNNLYGELEKMQSKAIFVDMYDAAHRGGINVSCEKAWNDYLKTKLNNNANFDGILNIVCSSAGYNTDKTNQMTACKNAINTAHHEHGVPLVNAANYLRNAQIAKSMLKALDQKDPDEAQLRLMRRNLTINGIGALNAANDTLPKIRAVMTAIVLGMIPFLVLFLVTPMFKQAAMFILGAMGWLATWGVMVAMTHTAAMDEALMVFDQIRAKGMGLDAVLHGQESAIQSLAIFGRMQTMSLMLASAIAMSVFKFGGYALTGIAQSHAENLQNLGEKSAHDTITPEGRAQTRDGLHHGIANQAAHSVYGNDAVGATATSQALTNAAQGEALSATGQLANISKNAGINAAGRLSGQSIAMDQTAQANGNSPIKNVTEAALMDVSNKINAKDSQMNQALKIGGGDLQEGIKIKTDSDAGSAYGNADANKDKSIKTGETAGEVAFDTAKIQTMENISEKEAINKERTSLGDGNTVKGSEKFHKTNQAWSAGQNQVTQEKIDKANGNALNAAIIDQRLNLGAAETFGTNINKAIDSGVVNAGTEAGRVESVQAFNEMMGKGTTPEDIRDTAVSMGVAQGISVPFNSKDEILYSPIGKAMSESQRNMLPNNGILKITANPNDNDTPLSFSLSNQGSVSNNHSAINDQSVKNQQGTIYENGLNLEAFRDAAFNNHDTFANDSTRQAVWSENKEAFDNLWQSAKGGDVRAKEQLADLGQMAQKDISGSMSNQDIISVAANQGVNSSLSVGLKTDGGLINMVSNAIGLDIKGSIGGNLGGNSEQRTQYSDAKQTDINRVMTNYMLDKSFESGSSDSFIQEFSNYHNSMREAAKDKYDNHDLGQEHYKNNKELDNQPTMTKRGLRYPRFAF